MKCDQCIERWHKGMMPACVDACKVGALVFGDLNELVKSARTRLAREVSVAVGEIKPGVSPSHPYVEAWREWGEKVDRINRR